MPLFWILLDLKVGEGIFSETKSKADACLLLVDAAAWDLGWPRVFVVSDLKVVLPLMCDCWTD